MSTSRRLTRLEEVSRDRAAAQLRRVWSSLTDEDIESCTQRAEELQPVSNGRNLARSRLGPPPGGGNTSIVSNSTKKARWLGVCRQIQMTRTGRGGVTLLLEAWPHLGVRVCHLPGEEGHTIPGQGSSTKPFCLPRT